MTDKTELLPCPFCGGVPARFYIMGTEAVACPACAATIGDPEPGRARAAWNRRADGWVSVEDALPSDGCAVLGFCDGDIEMMTYDRQFGWYYIDNDRAYNPVTHWRPLPPPPADS
jgi:hypothetical protein